MRLFSHVAVCGGVGLGLGLMVSGCAVAANMVIDSSNGVFGKEPVMGVVQASAQECAQIDAAGVGRAVWVTVGLNGYDYQECIRYYPYGLSATRSGNPQAIVYFSGDIWGSNGVDTTYLKSKPQDKQNESMQWSRKLNQPYIFVARPGTYGSSGVHKGARKPLESLLMTEALNQIKQRHSIANYVLVGHSSGGHVVASLLSKRQDVICAVASSAPASPMLRATLKKASSPVREFEPVNNLFSSTLHHPKLRVFVLGDLKDSNTPWASQKVLADKLQSLKWPVSTINLTAKDSSHHILADQARTIAGLCAQNQSTVQIKTIVEASGFK